MASQKAYLVGTAQGSYITRALRRLFVYWPARNEARRKASVRFIGQDEKQKCAMCKHLFTRKDTHVDHVLPVVDPARGVWSWDDYIERLFVLENRLQVLCKVCHNMKSKQENKERSRVRRKT
jgi:5-methylcytosine-specific restriction endonuclease McrA